MGLLETGWVAFDSETTGLDSTARIIELACVTFQNGEPVRTWSSFVRPIDVDWENPNVKQAMAVNQIEQAQLADCPTFDQIFSDLISELSHEVIVAHNTEFDIRMIRQELERMGRTGGDIPSSVQLDTKLLSYKLHPQTQGHRLQDVAPRWGVVPDGAHRAASDALTCGRILGAMARSHLPNDIGQVHELQKSASAGWNSRRRR